MLKVNSKPLLKSGDTYLVALAQHEPYARVYFEALEAGAAIDVRSANSTSATGTTSSNAFTAAQKGMRGFVNFPVSGDLRDRFNYITCTGGSVSFSVVSDPSF